MGIQRVDLSSESIHVFTKKLDDTGGCPFCEKAKEWLTEKGLPFTYEELDREERQQLYDHYGLEGGQRTVPQIIHIDFIGSQERIGGYQDLIISRVEDLFK